MMTVVPYKGSNPKSRLSSLLSEEERVIFARCMLHDVLKILEESDACKIVVLVKTLEKGLEDMDLFLNENDLNEALNEILARIDGPLLIVMPDLPLVKKEHINEILGRKEDVVISPGRRGGTNILFLRKPSEFIVDYHGTSYLDHLAIAEEKGLSVSIYDSFFVSSDIDETDDLIELFVHGGGSALDYLKNLDIVLKISGDEFCIKREV
ncbi:MAG: 2-phospho-L-lactate guanylyltransferase [Halobacteriota archaeon]|nr:2-phospho-L-lactate guanylyltransferase [Halobacteriota archaeon]